MDVNVWLHPPADFLPVRTEQEAGRAPDVSACNAVQLSWITATKRKQLDLCRVSCKWVLVCLFVCCTLATHNVTPCADRRQYKSRVAVSCRISPVAPTLSPCSRVARHARRGAVTDRQRHCALGTTADIWTTYGCQYSVVQTCPGAHPVPCTYNGYRVSTGVKWPECNAYHLPSSRTEVKHGYYWTSTPLCTSKDRLRGDLYLYGRMYWMFLQKQKQLDSVFESRILEI